MQTSTLLSAQNNRSTMSAASDSSHSQKPLSRSSVVSKGTQGLDLQQQVALLKQKAHQSFMQVIQIQQLHEEQLEQLHKQFAIKEKSYQEELETLRNRIKQLETENSSLQKNFRQHNFELQEELNIDIEPINCNNDSKLDESAISNFIELVNLQPSLQKLQSIKQDMKQQISAISLGNPQQLAKVQVMTDKLFEYVSHLNKQFNSLQDNCTLLKKQWQQNQDLNSNCKQYNESLQKQNKFMGQNIKRLAAEKMKAEKKATENERKIKILEDKITKYEETLQKKISNSPPEATHLVKSMTFEEKDRSLDLNEFIELNLIAKNQQKHKGLFPRHSKN